MSNTLLKIIHDTKAVSIWNRTTGPVFWYAAGMPGPFYVNTELVIGPDLAKSLLESINTIISSSNDPAERVKKLNATIMGAYAANAQYQTVIAALMDKVKSSFGPDAYHLISGGERRDWLFSIPLAAIMNLQHLFLFKNGIYYCETPITAGDKALHVADLINNAASYFDLWLPILKKARIACNATASVNTRGSNGIERLNKAGVKIAAINAIDETFFKSWCDQGLISPETLEELQTFFRSTEEWGTKYLTTDTSVFEVDKLDKKSFERLQVFFAQDPWGIKRRAPDFYQAMQKLIAERKAQAA